MQKSFFQAGLCKLDKAICAVVLVNMYEYIILALTLIACQCSIPMPNVPYRFLNNEKNWVWLCVKVLRCKNPFSRLDYVICTNVVLRYVTHGV